MQISVAARPHAGIEGPDELAGAGVLAFLPCQVVRQIQLAVQVSYAVRSEIRSRVVAPHPAVLVEPHQHVRARVGEARQARVTRFYRTVTLHLTERVAVQRQLREHDQVGTLFGGLADPGACVLEVRLDLPECTVHLCQRNSHHSTNSS